MTKTKRTQINPPVYEQGHLPVPRAVADLYGSFYYARQMDNYPPVIRTLIPTFEPLLVFIFGQGIQFYHQKTPASQHCVMLGSIRQAVSYELLPQTELLAVSIKADGFYRFFGFCPPAQIAPLKLSSLIGDSGCFEQLYNLLASLQTPDERVQALVEFCRPYPMQRPASLHRLLQPSDDLFSPVKVLAASTGQSLRSIQLQYKKYLGYSARQIARYDRFKKTLKILQKTAAKSGKVNWFDLIDQCGYYDQSQLIHDFKYYLQLSPLNYLREQDRFCLATN